MRKPLITYAKTKARISCAGTNQRLSETRRHAFSRRGSIKKDLHGNTCAMMVKFEEVLHSFKNYKCVRITFG